MWKDQIVDEVRAVREAYAKRFDYDIRRIGEDLQKQEEKAAKTPTRVKSQIKAKPGAKPKRRTA